MRLASVAGMIVIAVCMGVAGVRAIDDDRVIGGVARLAFAAGVAAIIVRNRLLVPRRSAVSIVTPVVPQADRVRE